MPQLILPHSVDRDQVRGLRHLFPSQEILELKDDGGVITVTKFAAEVEFPTDAEIAAADKEAAIAAVRLQRAPLLAETDIIAVRCLKAGRDFPLAWAKYTQDLREVTAASDPAAALAALQAPKLPEGV